MPYPDGDCSFTHKTAGLAVVGKSDWRYPLGSDTAKPTPLSTPQLAIMPVKHSGTGLLLVAKVMA